MILRVLDVYKRQPLIRVRSLVQVHSGPPSNLNIHGVLAQLGEHLPCTQGVIGSIPISSTNKHIRFRSIGIFFLH